MNKLKHFIFLFALVAFGQTAWAQFSGGDGTQANPYKISFASDWTTLANNVNSGTTYSGVYFKVTDVIYPALTMIGNSEENSFQGIFDGNGQKIVFMKNAESDEYAAPFRYVKNATIKRVYIDANEVTYIASSGHYTGGLVGHSSGNTNISNCDIKIVVSGTAGEGYHGGIVGCVADGVTTIDNCLFGGTLTGSSTHCGGFVGWVEGNNDARVILNNCLFNPKQVAWGTTGSCTFVRSRYDSDVTLINCYYTQTFGTAQGFSSAEGVNLGSGWVSNSTPDMSSYNLATATITGLPFWYDYTNSAITISYAVADADGNSLTEGTHYTAVIKDESGTEVEEVVAKGTYTLTITGTGSYRGTTSATFHVGKLTGGTGTATDPYLIYSNADWNELAANVNSGTSYSGQYFKMTNDIRVTTSLGSNSDGDTFYSFNGTFDGNGHTLNVTLNGSDDCVAPFTCISGATIKNLHITGSISTTGMRPASIASFVSGNSTITNCWSEVAISSSYNKDIDAGGFVARVNEDKTLTLNGCAFTGSITYSDENGYEGGGMVGFTQSNATATLNDCLFVPTAINITKYNTSGDNWKKHWMFVGGRKRGTYTNCYYNDVAAATSMVVENKQLRRIIPGENMAVTNANSGVFYNVSGIASYRPGMIYDAKLYAGSGEQVNLYMNYFGTVPEYYQVNYSASAGTLNGNVLTMPNADVVITATLTLNVEYELLFTEQNRSFYKFNYPSTNAAGEPITLSSLLAFWKPSGQMSNGVNNSVLINSHYTITADAQCPTHITNTLSADFPDYMLLSMLLSGSHDYPYQDLISKSVVIMPDYEGYGISVGSTHPYLAEALTAQQVVDGARCGLLVYQELVNSGNAPQLADDWRSFSVGYSQGGAVALAVQRHIEQNDLSEELRFRGTLCGDGPYDLITTLRYYMEDNGTSYDVTTDHRAGQATLPVVLPMILKGMIDSDPAMAGYQLTDYLTTDFLATGIMDWLGSKTVTNKQIATAWLQQLNNGTTTVNGTAYPAPGTMSQMFSKHQVPTALGIGTEDVPWADLSKVFTQGFYNYLRDANNFNSVPTSPANAYQAMHRALAGNNVCTGWEPSHRIMFMHSQYDMVVPYGNYLAFRDAHPSGENDLYRVDNTFSDSDHQATGTEFLLYLYQRGSYFHWIDEGIIEWDGSGTEDDPWLISNVDEWLLLADRVKNVDSYSGKFFKMTDDIKVSSMVGYNTDHTFRGTFDGDGHTLTVNLSSYSEFCAPFAYTYGATIKNLITTGTITTSKQHAGGVVGRNGSSCLTLENVKSSVTINSSYNGDAQHGGLVGYAIKADLIGCAFVGRILGGNSKGCGGLLGYKTNESDVTKKVTITNCLFAPTNITVSATNAYTLANNSSNGVVEISNCYYTQALGTVQGKQAHSITGAENVIVAFAGDATEYNVSDITTFGTGLQYGNELYAGQGDNVNLNLSAPIGFAIATATYTPEGGTATEIVPVEGVYSFVMPDVNVTINADYYVEWSGDGESWETAYLIYNTEQLDLLATRVNGGNDYSNSYFKLMNDIGYTYTGNNENNYTAIGNTGAQFNGHFDGQGYTISGIRIYKSGTDDNNNYQGLFGHIGSSGEVKNVVLTDAHITGYFYIGGIAGCNKGTVSHCHVTSSVNIHAPNYASFNHGGIAGANEGINSSSATISFCSSSATLTAVQELCYRYGAIVGDNNQYGLVTDNMAIGVTVPNVQTYGAITGQNSGEMARNYYVNCNVAGVPNATGVGCDGADVTANDGAVPGNVRTIEGYGNGNDKWVFIASPVLDEGGIAPTSVTNLVTTPASDYDLYRFNQSPTPIEDDYKEWENYKVHNFSIVNGQGYLYARKATGTLTFIGETYNTADSQEVSLVYETTNPSSKMHGYNLVGNPFPRAAYLTGRSYYKMSEDGSSVSATAASASDYIPPCTGVIVQATGEGQSVTFSTTAPEPQGANYNNGSLQIALSQKDTERGTAGRETLMDNAIVSFNEGSQLGKFYFGEQNANIYLPQGQEEYAIAYSDKQGEMPLNFKANENGTYTLTINPEGVEVGYLHLIDNMTGADVDLMQNPSYSFNAKVTDYESRFKLVFATADEAVCGPSEAFAFISNGNLIVNGTGTLQVIDLLGRQLTSQEIHSAFYILHSAFPTGVYVLRLINGNDVKTQKIVIE